MDIEEAKKIKYTFSKTEDRSAFGRGLLAAKEGKLKEANPFEAKEGSFKQEWWDEGWESYFSDEYPGIQDKPLYESGIKESELGDIRK
jgi:hypothetical protein